MGKGWPLECWICQYIALLSLFICCGKWRGESGKERGEGGGEREGKGGGGGGERERERERDYNHNMFLKTDLIFSTHVF